MLRLQVDSLAQPCFTFTFRCSTLVQVAGWLSLHWPWSLVPLVDIGLRASSGGQTRRRVHTCRRTKDHSMQRYLPKPGAQRRAWQCSRTMATRGAATRRAGSVHRAQCTELRGCRNGTEWADLPAPGDAPLARCSHRRRRLCAGSLKSDPHLIHPQVSPGATVHNGMRQCLTNITNSGLYVILTRPLSMQLNLKQKRPPILVSSSIS